MQSQLIEITKELITQGHFIEVVNANACENT